MSEWKEYKLCEVCENIYSGGTPSSMKASYWNGNLPWLSSGETNQRYIYNTEKRITKEGAEHSSTRYAYKDSTVIASAGQGHTRGQASMLCIDTYINQSVLVLKPNPLVIDPHFLFFNLDSRYNELRQLSDGTSTRGSLSGKILKDLNIKIPSLDEQKEIVSILKSLDDKIEVNRRINENLDQQAQALFKSWFVDFEPFKDGEFVESELGMIPKGWRVEKIGDFVKTTSGGTPSRKVNDYYVNGIFNWVKSKELQNTFIAETEEKITEEAIKNSSAKLLPPHSVLIAMYGATVGEFGIITQPMACNQAVCALLPNNIVPYSILYLLARNNKKELQNKAIGSAQQNISQVIIKDISFVFNEKAFFDFNHIIEPILKQIEINILESRRLAELRDTLLPKLMSGELKVENVTF